MKIGDHVVWLHEPRGGYGYTMHILGIVEAISEKRVKIGVRKVDGSWVSRWVTPQRLKPRQPK